MACGPIVVDGPKLFVGVFNLLPPVFPAWAGVNYGYVQVFLPSQVGAAGSRIFGVSMLP
jgi:hypothetical protein